MAAVAVVTRNRRLQSLMVAAVTTGAASVDPTASASLEILLLTVSVGRTARALKLTSCASPCCK